MSDRASRAAILVVSAGLIAAALLLDLPRRTGGRFWGDGATFYGMALSLAEDLDLRYEAKDVLRIRREYSFGPQGLFLKRASGGLTAEGASGFPWIRRVGPEEPRLYYAKAYVYPLLAAPFVALLRTRGLLLFNAIAFSLTLWLAYGELARQRDPGRALALTLAFFLATVTPLYLVWLTPEVFGMLLATAGLLAGRRSRPLLGAVLLGVATYMKPPNLLLALPLGLEPLLSQRWRGFPESLRRGAVMAAVTAALFGINALITGEMNYQGGERKTFDRKYPLEDHGLTFENTGFWMTTEHLGPLVEGQDEELQTERTDPVRAAAELRGSFLRNLGYFWVGRFGGAVPYFFPVVAAVAVFLLAGLRDRPGALALLALLVSYLFYIWLIPANWYGGGGAVGNRYFLNLLPLVLFIVPRRLEGLVAAGGVVAAGLLLAPVLAAPVQHSLEPGRHATAAAFRPFPLELTELNDLSVFTQPWRKKRPFGDTEGNRREGRPADPDAYYLYFPDDGTYGKEGEGFWLRGGERAEVVLRALEPVKTLGVRVTGGPAGDDASLRVGSASTEWTVGPGESRDTVLTPPVGFDYYGTVLYVLQLHSRRAADPPPGETRRLGSFVQIRLEASRSAAEPQKRPSAARPAPPWSPSADLSRSRAPGRSGLNRSAS